MIIRLSTEQISTHWEAIKDMLSKAIPDIPGQLANRDNNILRSLTIGELVCWVGYKKLAEKQNEIICMLITRIIYDDITGVRSLLIYCLAGWETMELDFYDEGLKTLLDYSKEAGCFRILFYSEEPRILNVTTALGFNVDTRYGVYNIPS